MRIGISIKPWNEGGYGRFGERTYKKLKEHGYSCVDYDMADTDSVIYTSSDEEMHKLLFHQKELATDAGIEIFRFMARGVGLQGILPKRTEMNEWKK